MSNGNRTTVIVVGVASMFCFAIAGAVAIAWAVPDGANAGTLISLLFGALALAIPAVVGLAKNLDAAQKTEEVAQGVSKLRNGEMDAKLRLAVAEILAPHLVDPAAQPQLELDQAVRDAAAEEEDLR